MYAGKNHNINQKHYTTLYIFRDMRKKHVLNYTMVVTRVGVKKKNWNLIFMQFSQFDQWGSYTKLLRWS